MAVADWPAAGDSAVRRDAVADHAREILGAAPLTPVYRAALTMALTLPGNIVSDRPDTRWARLVWTCCTAAGGRWEQAVPAAAAVELFMVGLDLLDDAEDGEENAVQAGLGMARALNVSTGLLFLAQQSVLATAGRAAAGILLDAGLRACSGQDADLTPEAERHTDLDAALSVAAGKSASLVAAICRLGALCADADAPTQDLYARFGRYLGLVRQLANDIAGIRPGVTGKTDIALGRPTLPLTYAALHPSSAGIPPDPWDGAPAYLTWVVAEAYRRHALALITAMTADGAGRVCLAALLDAL